MNYPTDLSPAETERARTRLAELAEQFTAKQILRTPAWREVFQRTWRHPYVPAYYPDKDTPPVLCVDGSRREEWLDAVYSDTTLITKLMPVPLSRALRPAVEMTYTSSSTLPSLVLEMLDELDVADGHRVLEIGTGSGYNAALLCQRLGSQQVTSVDIDPELVDLARERLAANGYTPVLAVTDGHTGYPPGAPYDRIIATCAVSTIPAAWLQQAAPGAVILTDLHGPLGGTLVRLTVNDHGSATGRFLPHWAGFMTMRHNIEPIRPRWPLLELPATHSWTMIDPITLNTHGLFGFIVQWQLPNVTQGRMTNDDGAPAVFLLARDGSRAEIDTIPTERGYPVRQYGPQPLWDRVEHAARFWDEHGHPSYERFGLTATTTEQYIWYDQPDGPHRWPLSLDQGNTAPPRR
ncbi:MAG TPA: ATP-grasp peptide maturase system methyltransferase [Pseudonocardiaceae bacterium]|nr:ATP-grasp peptide maturase system methyltransferase [Pseudonocardiaceae bacterium]